MLKRIGDDLWIDIDAIQSVWYGTARNRNNNLETVFHFSGEKVVYYLGDDNRRILERWLNARERREEDERNLC